MHLLLHLQHLLKFHRHSMCSPRVQVPEGEACVLETQIFWPGLECGTIHATKNISERSMGRCERRCRSGRDARQTRERGRERRRLVLEHLLCSRLRHCEFARKWRRRRLRVRQGYCVTVVLRSTDNIDIAVLQ